MFFVDSLSNIAAFRLGKFNFAKSFLDPKSLLQDELLITKSVYYGHFIFLFVSIHVRKSIYTFCYIQYIPSFKIFIDHQLHQPEFQSIFPDS